MRLDYHQDIKSQAVRILIIDDNSPFVLPLLRSFSGYKNIHLDILLSSTNRAMHFKYSRYIGKILQVEELEDGNLVTTIKDAVARFNSDLLISTREWISALLFEKKEELEGFVNLHPLPDSRTLKITGNKWKLNQWLIENELPHTYCSENLSEWTGNYPVLIKPVFGIGGKGIQKADDREELKKLLKKKNLPKREFIVQEFIEGYDIDVSFLAVEGSILYHTIQKGLISKDMMYSKGIEFVKNDKLLQQVSLIISELNFTGIAHLDFRYSKLKDEYILIDFNSRYWSSVQGSRAMGINFPFLAVEWALGGELKQLNYRTGYYYFTSAALKTIMNNLFKRGGYPVKLKDTQLTYIYRDPLPELMFLLQSMGRKRRNRIA